MLPGTSFVSYSTGAPSPAVYNNRFFGISPVIGSPFIGGGCPFGGVGLGAPLLGNIAGIGGYGMPLGLGGLDMNVFTPF